MEVQTIHKDTRRSAVVMLRKVGQVLGILVLLSIVGASVSTWANAREKDLFEAAANGDLHRVRSLLDAKADVNAQRADGVTALIIASENGHRAVVRALLDARAEVNAKAGDGATALTQASQQGYREVVRMLLDAKGDVNAQRIDGVTALIIASQNGHSEVVRVLLARVRQKYG